MRCAKVRKIIHGNRMPDGARPMGMNREQRNLHKNGAALALLACLLAAQPALPATAASSSQTAPTPRTAADTSAAAAPVDTVYVVVPPASVPTPVPRTPRATSVDPFVCALVGIIPLSSGYYLTEAPRKGIAFSLADAVLIGSIWNIRRDDHIPDSDVVPYFVLLGAVNALDAILSGLQARNDAVRVRTTLTPSGEPMVGLAWTF